MTQRGKELVAALFIAVSGIIMVTGFVYLVLEALRELN